MDIGTHPPLQYNRLLICRVMSCHQHRTAKKWHLALTEEGLNLLRWMLLIPIGGRLGERT